jgi:GT2 family glycosyltransferase
MGENPGTVSVTIVTHNSEAFIDRSLKSVLSQDWPRLEVIVVDNDSRDRTRPILDGYKDRIRVLLNSENRGFSAAQNQAIRQASGDWILALNPDVRLTANFLSLLLERKLESDIGTVCGKLIRALPNLEVPEQIRLDSAGIYFTPSFRHLDRGSNTPDREEYNRPALVFGATAAAALYRRTMMEDVSVEGEFFDEDFFLYREDADVSWRAQLQGWRCLYLPQAVGYHVRTVFPDRRRTLPPLINRQSVQNRFLMRIKNATLRLYLRNFLPVTARDLGVIIYCLLAERSSLGAFVSVFHLWRRTFAKRRIIQERRRVSNAYLQSWFGYRPVTFPVEIPPQIQAGLSAVPGARSAVSLPAAGPGQLRPL